MNELARSAIELRDLVERFASLSEGALRATADGDSAVLSAQLDARELLLTRANAIAALLRARRATLNAADRRSLDELLRPVERAAEHASAVNERLHVSAAGARAQFGARLDHLRIESGAASAYQANPGVGRAVDARR